MQWNSVTLDGKNIDELGFKLKSVRLSQKTMVAKDGIDMKEIHG
jgi:hypothetical protein